MSVDHSDRARLYAHRAMKSAAILTLHSCPLGTAGEGDVGGMNVYALGLARELARRGARVDIFTREHSGGHAIRLDEPGIDIVHVGAAPASAAKESLHEYTMDFAEAIGALRPDGGGYDIIHSHYWVSGLVGLQLAERWGASHATTFHTVAALKEEAFPSGLEPQARHDAERLIAQSADRIVAWTQHEADALSRLLGADPSRISVTPIGIDKGRFHRLDKRAARAQLGIAADEETLLYIGRLDLIKGADVLLEALSLIENRPRLRLRIVGGGTASITPAALASLAQSLGVAERISFPGAAPNAELPLHYAAADMLVVPSWYESFSIAAAEAMACGTPVIASNVPGPASFIRDGESGRLVPPGDARALADAISGLLGDPALQQRLSAGATGAVSHLEWESIGDSMSTIYSDLIARERVTAGAGPGAV